LIGLKREGKEGATEKMGGKARGCGEQLRTVALIITRGEMGLR
jgi:hypothetical protein